MKLDRAAQLFTFCRDEWREERCHERSRCVSYLEAPSVPGVPDVSSAQTSDRACSSLEGL